MPNRLEIPPELSELIEKREVEDRRKEDVAASNSDPKTNASCEERRSGQDRRANES